ncbi:MAG: tyrosine-protein phosphatase, partial [SAR86 cluster bacterium]|nr:tyrosine-protein phosphatase [SAR86 cluster bacterium]
MSYRRLLPLEGGPNFRDMGGYITTDGQRVRRGLLFRSAAMAALTAQDMLYLD